MIEQIKQISFSAYVKQHSNTEQKPSRDTPEEVTEPTHENLTPHNTQSPVFSSQLQDY